MIKKLQNLGLLLCGAIIAYAVLPGSVQAQINNRAVTLVTAAGTVIGSAATSWLTVRITDGTNYVTLAQDSTHDSAVGSTGPAVMGEASTSLASDTAVADGDASRLKTDINGRQIKVEGCNRESRFSAQASNTDGASTSLLAAQGASTYIEVYGVILANQSAADTIVDIRDGTAGSVKATIPAPATTDTLGGAVVVFPVPLTMSANTALAFDAGAPTTTLYITAVGCVAK